MTADFPAAPSVEALETGDVLAPRFGPDGLIAAIAQHAETGEVLMLAWMNAEALRATDELHHDKFISDATWMGLRGAFTEKQCMDLVFTVGQYTQVSMILNTFGIPLDPGQVLDPDLKGY